MTQPGQIGGQFIGDDWIPRKLKDVERALQELSAADILATAGISVIPDGVIVNGLMQFKRTDGTVGVSVDPATGTFVAYNAAGTAPVARFGSLIETAPTEYGVEVLVGSTWVRLGNQTTTWASVSGKPSVYPPETHTHAGAEITSAVANATNAVDATRAAQADGVTPDAFSREIGGIPGSYFTMWMHSNGQIGRNTSGQKYKKNVRDFALSDAQLMALRSRVYDRKATDADDFTPAVSVDEIGMIAEEVAAVIPQLALTFDGEVDGVFYERIAVALLPKVQAQQRELAEQRSQIDKLTALARAHGWDI